MQKKLFIALALSFALVGAAYAQENNQVQGPIEELGGCSSKEECKAYCDEPSHVQACVSYAVKAGFMTQAEAERALKFANQTGPGGCTGSACKTYCSQKDNFAECRAFAEKNGLTGPRGEGPRGDEGPKIDKAKAEELIAAKGGPGGCSNFEECHAYCDNESNMDTCFAYAKENNLMSQEEVERAQKFTNQEGPGGCKGRECKAYCEDSSHAEECFAFAEEHGFVSKEESQRSRALLSQPGPGGCIGIACRDYCADPSHREECYAFAKQNGFVEEHQDFGERGEMNADEGERRFGPPPPGAQCSTPEECKALYESRSSGERPCNTPEECKALYESRSQGQGQGERGGPPQEDGANITPEMRQKYEQYRSEHPSTNTEQARPPEGYQMTPEQQQQYDQYRSGGYKPPEGSTAPYPPSGTNQYQPPPSDTSGSYQYQGGYPSGASGGYEGTPTNYTPPPSSGGETSGSTPPPPPPPPPSSFNPAALTASVLSAFLSFFGW